MRVMVVEGNTPEIVSAKEGAGAARPPAEIYAAALRRFRPALETVIARPFFDAPLPPLDGIDGVALTGSGVAFSADDARAAPHRAVVERAMAAGIPILGSCWGLQVMAVILGGAVGVSGAGIQAPIARDVTLTPAGRGHPMHRRRSEIFDVPCIHRDVVTRLPSGAVITAANAQTDVQAMIYERDGLSIWGVQYHPEHAVSDMLRYLTMAGAEAILRGATVLGGADPHRIMAEVATIETDPARHAAAAAQHGLGRDVLDPTTRGAELAAWLDALTARNAPDMPAAANTS
ncbi:MAG: type 1 glutamine amidotransferase [Pseudomonadota bacterium]